MESNGRTRNATPLVSVSSEELLEQIAIEPVSIPIALRAGKIDGELAARGLRVALADLLIGATALHLGFELVTDNTRHFRMIPTLVVKQL
jgi:predicted nucleic acid-binding protein